MHLNDWHQCRRWRIWGYRCPFEGEKDHEDEEPPDEDLRGERPESRSFLEDANVPFIYFIGHRPAAESLKVDQTPTQVPQPIPFPEPVPGKTPEGLPEAAIKLRDPRHLGVPDAGAIKALQRSYVRSARRNLNWRRAYHRSLEPFRDSVTSGARAPSPALTPTPSPAVPAGRRSALGTYASVVSRHRDAAEAGEISLVRSLEHSDSRFERRTSRQVARKRSLDRRNSIIKKTVAAAATAAVAYGATRLLGGPPAGGGFQMQDVIRPNRPIPGTP